MSEDIRLIALERAVERLCRRVEMIEQEAVSAKSTIDAHIRKFAHRLSTAEKSVTDTLVRFDKRLAQETRGDALNLQTISILIDDVPTTILAVIEEDTSDEKLPDGRR